MPAVMEQIDRMTTEEKFKTAAGLERSIPWKTARAFLDCRLANRFHQTIYYRKDGRVVTVWRVLDQRFDPRRVDACLRDPDYQG